MKQLLALLLLCACASAYGQQLILCSPSTPCDTSSGPSNTGTGDPFWKAWGKANANFSAMSPFYWAKSPAYGACTWDATHDVGACVNAAKAAAVAAGGGTVLFPCGTFGLTTPVVFDTNGVHARGCGTGSPQDANTAGTYFKWIGGSAAGVTAWKVAGTNTLFNVDQEGFTVSCNSKPGAGTTQGCDYAVVLDGVSYSNFDVGGAESTKANIWVTTHTGQTSHGTQRNYFKLWSNSTSTTYGPVGILVDGRAASNLNVSLNTFLNLDAQFNLGAGAVVFGNSDNNLILYRYAWALGGYPGTATAPAFVAANTAYTTANGAIEGRARLLRVMRNGGKSVTWVQGTRNGATFTAAGGNGGSAGLQSFSLTTNANPSISLTKLKFASVTDGTTGLAVDPGMAVNCAGGAQNGVGPNAVIRKVDAGGTVGVILVQPQAASVGANIACTFSWNTTATTKDGTYVLSYCTSAVPAQCASYTTAGYYLNAGSTGGTSQGPVALSDTGSGSNGFLKFTDFTIPWTGTPSNGDFWTIVTPQPSFSTSFEGVDNGNHTSSPDWEYGATGWSQYMNQPCHVPFPAGTMFQGAIVDTLTSGTDTCTIALSP